MISPTVGRIVLFHMTDEQLKYLRLGGDKRGSISRDPRQPMAATVVYVHGDRCVNLSVTDHNGERFSFTSVSLLQDEELPGGNGMWAEWMPFQKGQAAKTRELNPNELAKG